MYEVFPFQNGWIVAFVHEGQQPNLSIKRVVYSTREEAAAKCEALNAVAHGVSK